MVFDNHDKLVLIDEWTGDDRHDVMVDTDVGIGYRSHWVTVPVHTYNFLRGR